ncbi:MAG: hypothetical protein QT02_C0008G0002 [archaeon GW2011_AR9]|nr:MAG: hypothetical protein QT02_C0008G0002 [archaeon GW2011_AR9]MBS3120980.1 AI-2E family transporter [Candidatus Woesearchaeota archaeon]HIH13534.1 AI-2E family transporter [Candidatus Woesearchaeota archaeon]
MDTLRYQPYVPLLLLLVLVVVSFLVLKPLLLALFLGGLLAYIFFPVYSALQRKIKRKSLAAALMCIVVFALLVIPSVFLTKTLVQESYVLFISVKQKLATGLFSNCHNQFCESIRGFGKDPSVAYQIQEVSKFITNWVIQKGSDFLLRLPRLTLNLVVIFFSLFFFLRDGDKFVEHIQQVLGLHQHKFSAIMARLKEILHGLVYGYFIVALIQGALGALGFFIFGINSPLFWGVVMGLLALIPFVGTGLIWVPAAVIFLLEGVFQGSSLLIWKGIGLFVYGLVFISGLDNVIKPILIGERAKIHPAIIMFGTFGGIFLFGPVGVIIGPLLLSLTTVVIATYLEEE